MVEVRVDDAPDDLGEPLDCATTGTVVDPEDETTIAGPVGAELEAASEAGAVAVAVTTATPLFPEAVKVTTLPSGVVEAAAGATAREDVTVNVNTPPAASVVVDVATVWTISGVEEVVVGEA